jgi:hypothetical protein
LSGDQEKALRQCEIIGADDEKLAGDLMAWIKRSGSGKK